MYNIGTEETQMVFSKNVKHDPVQRAMEKHSIQITYQLVPILVDILPVETLEHMHRDMYNNLHSSKHYRSNCENHLNVNGYKRK